MNDNLEPPEYGINLWLPSAARELKERGFTASEVTQYLKNWEPKLRRPYQPNEVERAMALVFETPFQKSPTMNRVRKAKPVFNPSLLAQIAATLPEADEAWFKARSPIPVDEQTTDSFLQCITNKGERILCFQKMQSQGQHLWCNREGRSDTLSSWEHGLKQGSWFLPQPITGKRIELDRLKSEHNPTGRSRRAEECVACFRFALLESDVANPAHWLSALAQLPLPIVSIVTSGGKSIHALILVNAPNKAAWDTVREWLLPTVVPLGADPAALTAVRLTRLPFIHRGERLQELLFLNTNPTGTPIAKFPPLR